MHLLLTRYPIATLFSISLCMFWPVAKWYGSRVLEPNGEYWSLLPLLAAALLLRTQTARQSIKIDIRPASVALLFYCLAYWFVPPIFRAMFALLAIGTILAADRDIRSIPVAIWGLLLLALPVVASLQFYLGYPVRVMAGEISLLLLKLNSLSVVREGVVLNWGGSLVSIDAPCSGIKMLWTGLFLSFVLAGAYRLKWMQTAYLVAMTVIVVIIGNAFRVTSLFYIETGMVPSPGWAHDTIGLMTFVFIAVLVAWQAQVLFKRRAVCRPTVRI